MQCLLEKILGKKFCYGGTGMDVAFPGPNQGLVTKNARIRCFNCQRITKDDYLAEQEQNAATTLRFLDPCPEPCYLCEEYDEPDDPHPIVPGTTVGHCAKSRLPWHARHICVPCQAELDAILGWADGAGPTSEGAGAGAGGGEAGDGEQGHSKARDGVR